MEQKHKVVKSRYSKAIEFLKRRWMFILLFFALLLVGSILFVKNNSRTTVLASKQLAKDFSVVKVEGINYPFELTAKKSSTILELLNKLGIYEVEKVYAQNSKSWKEINLNDKINSDITIKVQMK